jgi:predicted DNA-binding helix-hairpin-helix protein
MADNQSRVSININVEVSEALTGLKAIQREAKKATQALRELEEVTININEDTDVDKLAKSLAKQIYLAGERYE